jgi:hypothetical protein
MKTSRRIEALPDLDPVDAEAFTRAIELYRGLGRDRSEQVDHWLRCDGWLQAARYCAANCQKSLIRPRLWLELPMYVEPSDIEGIIARGPDRGGEYQAAKILRKLLRAGLSRFEPEPLKALAAAKRTKAEPAAPTTTAPAPTSTDGSPAVQSGQEETKAPVPSRRRA